MGGPRTFYSITGFHLRVFGVLSSSPSLPRSVLIDTNHFCGCRPLRSEISASLRLCVRLLLPPRRRCRKEFFSPPESQGLVIKPGGKGLNTTPEASNSRIMAIIRRGQDTEILKTAIYFFCRALHLPAINPDRTIILLNH